MIRRERERESRVIEKLESRFSLPWECNDDDESNFGKYEHFKRSAGGGGELLISDGLCGNRLNFSGKHFEDNFLID